MGKIIYLLMIICAVQIASVAAQTNGITINLTSGKKVYTRSIDKTLSLRIVKDSSVENKDFGWLVEVVKKPYRKTSENLVYQNETGTTADASQIYAWHISSGEFPNERELNVKNYPYAIKISLVEPKTAGEGPDAKFLSGKLKISWTRSN